MCDYFHTGGSVWAMMTGKVDKSTFSLLDFFRSLVLHCASIQDIRLVRLVETVCIVSAADFDLSDQDVTSLLSCLYSEIPNLSDQALLTIVACSVDVSSYTTSVTVFSEVATVATTASVLLDHYRHRCRLHQNREPQRILGFPSGSYCVCVAFEASQISQCPV